MAIKLILSDIDGTILDDKNVIDSGLKQAVSQLKKTGGTICFGICSLTGRNVADC